MLKRHRARLLSAWWQRLRSHASGDPGAQSSSGAHRFVRAGLTGLTSSIAKAIALVCTLAMAPLTFRYLGVERFGLWMTITSLLLFVTFADLGVGSGLTTALSKALGLRDPAGARQSVSCAFLMLGGLGLVVTLAFYALYPHIAWARLYGVRSPQAVQEAGPATAILLVCTACNMPLGTVARVQMGYQQAFVTDLWTAAGSLLGLVGVVISIHLRAGLTGLVLSYAGATVLMQATNWVVEFGWRHPELRPRVNLFSGRQSAELGSIGFLFFLQQIFGLVYYVSDNLVISKTLGSVEVGRFAMAQKLFSAGLVAQLFLNPLWPAFGEAIARGDHAWTRKALGHVRWISLGAGGACGLGLLAISQPVLHHWMGAEAHHLTGLCVALALWVVLVSYVAGMNSALNHPGLMVRHLWLFGASSIVALGLKILLAPRFGIESVVWATLAAFGVIYVIPVAWLAHYSFERMVLEDNAALEDLVTVAGAPNAL